tara:strand:+ start:1343 stop:1867 length:525 start_codon:yes stop_codon:yes gene_type:complete
MTTTITGALGIDNIKAATGAVLQVVSVNKTDAFSTSSQSFVDIAGLTLSITPTSTSSKIVVDVDYTGSCLGHASIRLVRDSTPIYIGTGATGIQINVGMQFASNGTLNHAYQLSKGTMKTLDSPSTTSAVTYKVQGAVPHHASYILYCNRIHQNENNKFIGYGASSITLTEIAG